MSRNAAGRLGTHDFRAVLDFLDEIRELDLEDAYSVDVLARIQTVVACDAVGYQHVDLRTRQFLPGTVGTGSIPDAGDDDEAQYWAAGPCPLTEYRDRTRDLRAARLVDVIGLRRYRELPICRDYYGPIGIHPLLDLGVSTEPGHFRSIILFRGGDAPGYSERDRDVLELLRPHFQAREARAELYRHLAGDVVAAADERDVDAALTLREREIVHLVGQGKTNAEIAAELWITPGTVKKHLEHVYEKLGVSGRTAAATAAAAALAR
ncbi:MAG: helix-turn-helix transcriptional regulator [Chloroflexota bacterium]